MMNIKLSSTWRTGWAGGDEAEAVGDAEYPRLDPVAPGGEGETNVVEAAVDYRGAEKVLDAGVDVAGKAS